MLLLCSASISVCSKYRQSYSEVSHALKMEQAVQNGSIKVEVQLCIYHNNLVSNLQID